MKEGRYFTAGSNRRTFQFPRRCSRVREPVLTAVHTRHAATASTLDMRDPPSRSLSWQPHVTSVRRCQVPIHVRGDVKWRDGQPFTSAERPVLDRAAQVSSSAPRSTRCERHAVRRPMRVPPSSKYRSPRNIRSRRSRRVNRQSYRSLRTHSAIRCRIRTAMSPSVRGR